MYSVYTYIHIYIARVLFLSLCVCIYIRICICNYAFSRAIKEIETNPLEQDKSL